MKFLFKLKSESLKKCSDWFNIQSIDSLEDAIDSFAEDATICELNVKDVECQLEDFYSEQGLGENLQCEILDFDAIKETIDIYIGKSLTTKNLKHLLLIVRFKIFTLKMVM